MPLDPRQAAGRTIRTYGQTSDHKWIVRLTAGGHVRRVMATRFGPRWP